MVVDVKVVIGTLSMFINNLSNIHVLKSVKVSLQTLSKRSRSAKLAALVSETDCPP